MGMVAVICVQTARRATAGAIFFQVFQGGMRRYQGRGFRDDDVNPGQVQTGEEGLSNNGSDCEADGMHEGSSDDVGDQTPNEVPHQEDRQATEARPVASL